MTGQIARLGKGLQTDTLGQPLREGDRVCFPYFYPCRRCSQCARGQLAACPHKQRRPALRAAYPWNGAYGEYYYVRPGHFLYKVPDDLSTEVVATLNCALAQVLYAFQVIKVEPDDTVVIQGAGALGLYALAAARFAGARQVIAIDGNIHRLALATRFHADHVIDINQLPSPSDRIARVLSLTDGQGADLVVDLAGVPAVIPEGLTMLRSGGRYLEIGCIGSRQQITLDPSQLVFGSLCLQGVYQYHPEIIPLAFHFLRQNQQLYPFDQIITHRFTLAEINEAFLCADTQKTAASQNLCLRAIIIP
jgi:threonine dehydrogenase-like Zn-dependent dehydrogenase